MVRRFCQNVWRYNVKNDTARLLSENGEMLESIMLLLQSVAMFPILIAIAVVLGVSFSWKMVDDRFVTAVIYVWLALIVINIFHMSYSAVFVGLYMAQAQAVDVASHTLALFCFAGVLDGLNHLLAVKRACAAAAAAGEVN